MRGQRYRAAFAKLEQWGIPGMHISYERLLQRPETMNEVMRFIGVNDSEVCTLPQCDLQGEVNECKYPRRRHHTHVFLQHIDTPNKPAPEHSIQ
jgi:hypothetical protein